MNRIRRVRRLFAALAGLAGALLAFVAAPPAALARPGPPRPWQLQYQPVHSLPPGWYKHPPLPAHIQTAATSGMPGWQVTLIAAVVLAAALAMMVYRIRAARRGSASTARVITASGTTSASSRPSATA